MTTVLLLIHMFVTLALIGVVLIQRNEGGGLGIGSSQGMGAFMTGRGTANLLTRTTSILAAIFLALSLVLALLSHGGVSGPSILDLPATGPTSSLPVLPGGGPAPAPASGGTTGAAPAPAPGAPNAASSPAPKAASPATQVQPKPAPQGPSVPTN
jgi:preprotein translocase subunit SecG